MLDDCDIGLLIEAQTCFVFAYLPILTKETFWWWFLVPLKIYSQTEKFFLFYFKIWIIVNFLES